MADNDSDVATIQWKKNPFKITTVLLTSLTYFIQLGKTEEKTLDSVVYR